MKVEEIIDLYLKGRTCTNRNNIDSSNGMSGYIILLENIIEESKKNYIEQWTNEFPEWFLNCSESTKLLEPKAPIESYVGFISAFIILGMALESLLEVDIKKLLETF